MRSLRFHVIFDQELSVLFRHNNRAGHSFTKRSCSGCTSRCIVNTTTKRRKHKPFKLRTTFFHIFPVGGMFSSPKFLSIVFYPQLKYHTYFQLREHSFGFLNFSYHMFHIFCSYIITVKKLHDHLMTACKQQRNTVPSTMRKKKRQMTERTPCELQRFSIKTQKRVLLIHFFE